MDTLSIVEHSFFSTSVLSPLDDSALYTITSRRHPSGYWIDVVDRVERGEGGPGVPLSKHSESNSHSDAVLHTELATVLYVDAGTTRVQFPGNNLDGAMLEGEGEVGLDAFLRRRKPYSNSRVFMGPGGVMYKWRIDGKRLELYNTTTDTLVARSTPRRSKFAFPLPLPRLPKRTRSAISLLLPVAPEPAERPRFQHPTLSLHPSLLRLESDSDVAAAAAQQLRDAVVLTFVIMQRLLKERLRYRQYL